MSPPLHKIRDYCLRKCSFFPPLAITISTQPWELAFDKGGDSSSWVAFSTAIAGLKVYIVTFPSTGPHSPTLLDFRLGV